MIEDNLLEGNKYLDCYWRICNRAKDRVLDPIVYIEKHHIYPKSIYGQNKNLVKLTAKEHYIVHLLLWWGLRTKYGIKDINTRKMAGAFNCICRISKGQDRVKMNSSRYELQRIARYENAKEYWAQEENRKRHSELLKSIWEKEDFKNNFLELIHNTEYKKKHKERCKNNKFTKEAHEKSINLRKGKKQSPETLRKRSIGCSKAVEQYDLNNNFIKEYISVKLARKETGASHISACCKGKMHTSKGFIWKYKHEVKI